MFIYSIKAKTVKMFGLICARLVGVIMLAAFVPGREAVSASANGEIDYFARPKVRAVATYIQKMFLSGRTSISAAMLRLDLSTARCCRYSPS